MKFRNHKNLLDCKFSKDHPSCNFLNFLLGRIVNDKRFHTKCVYDGLTGSQIITVGLVKAAQTISSGERPTFQNFGLEFFLTRLSRQSIGERILPLGTDCTIQSEPRDHVQK